MAKSFPLNGSCKTSETSGYDPLGATAARFAAAVATLLLLTGCGSSGPQPSTAASQAAATKPAASPSGSGSPQPASAASQAPTTKIVVSYSEVFGNFLPLWVAKDAGIFRNNGLDVDLKFIASTTSLPALLSGQTQIAGVGGSAILNAVTSGANLEVIAEQAPTFPYLFMAASTVKTPADLKGLKVGVSKFGSASDVATRVALNKMGLMPEKDVTIIQVGTTQNRAAALQSGAIQGAVSQPPESLGLEKQGAHTLFDLAAQHLPGANGSYGLQRAWAADHHGVVQKFIDSLVEGTARMRSDQAYSLAELEEYYKSSDKAAMQATYDFYKSEIIPPLPYPKVEQYDNAKQQLASSNDKVASFDVASMLDASYVQSAADRGLGRG